MVLEPKHTSNFFFLNYVSTKNKIMEAGNLVCTYPIVQSKETQWPLDHNDRAASSPALLAS